MLAGTGWEWDWKSIPVQNSGLVNIPVSFIVTLQAVHEVSWQQYLHRWTNKLTDKWDSLKTRQLLNLHNLRHSDSLQNRVSAITQSQQTSHLVGQLLWQSSEHLNWPDQSSLELWRESDNSPAWWIQAACFESESRCPEAGRPLELWSFRADQSGSSWVLPRNNSHFNYTLISHHRLHESTSPVLMATGLVNGKWQISTPTE